MATTDTSGTSVTRSLSELMSMPCWLALTNQQGSFLGSYISVGRSTGKYDAVRAAKLNYRCRDSKGAQIRAAQLLNSSAVRLVLDAHYRRSETDAGILEVKRLLKQSLKLWKRATAALEAIEAQEKVRG